MTARVRHLRTKFVDDPADPAQLIPAESGKVWVFGIFQ